MENRLVMGVYGVTWAYDPHGKRVFTETDTFGQGGAPCELDFYGIGGKKLAAFGCQYDDNGIFSWGPPTYNVYFGKKLIRSKSLTVVTDRLGSIRGTSNNENTRYASYGNERTSTPDRREKWGTYFRDVGTGLDYADQRYKGVGLGAFLSPDPGGIATANPKNPGSWNRYAYVLGDPVNRRGPTGRIEIICTDPDADSIYDASCYGDGGFDGGGGGGDPCYGSYFDPAPNPACYADVPAPPPTATTPPAPSCSLELEYRQTALTPRSHPSLVVDDSYGYTFTIQGQPQYYPIRMGLPPSWGNLVVSNTPGNIGNQQWGPLLTSGTDPRLCNQLSDIETAENNYANDPVAYYPWGPNSNSLINWLLQSGYVARYFTAPPKTTGWNTPLCGTLRGTY